MKNALSLKVVWRQRGDEGVLWADFYRAAVDRCMMFLCGQVLPDKSLCHCYCCHGGGSKSNLPRWLRTLHTLTVWMFMTGIAVRWSQDAQPPLVLESHHLVLLVWWGRVLTAEGAEEGSYRAPQERPCQPWNRSNCFSHSNRINKNIIVWDFQSGMSSLPDQPPPVAVIPSSERTSAPEVTSSEEECQESRE